MMLDDVVSTLVLCSVAGTPSLYVHSVQKCLCFSKPITGPYPLFPFTPQSIKVTSTTMKIDYNLSFSFISNPSFH